jgi:hypothetical protein
MDVVDANNIWAVGANGGIVKYTDAGPLPSIAPRAHAAIPASENFPNPFNPSTTIRFSLSARAAVSVVVHNILGQEVARLAENEDMGAGAHEVVFSARGGSGAELPSGVYFYRIQADGGRIARTGKMLLMK